MLEPSADQVSAFSDVRIGHWSDESAGTGCTVVLLPEDNVASGEVRGGAPGTREWALLDPRCTVGQVNAVVLCGRSAFGLAACDGVVRWLEENGAGYPTPAARVPIVVGMVLYDLSEGDPRVRPGPEQGYAACAGALPWGEACLQGRLGAGCGATVGKWRGLDSRSPGGLGSAFASGPEGLVVGALLAVNAYGELRVPGEVRVPDAVRGPDEVRVPDAVRGPDDVPHISAPGLSAPRNTGEGLQATTIGIVVTNASLDKTACLRVSESAHDGLARALDPVHSAYDGDALVATCLGAVDADTEVVRSLAAWAVEQAVYRAVAG